MGQAKINQRAAFTPQLVEKWEADDCVHFAVGLARLTGWILHVDWWTSSSERAEKIPPDRLAPLRVYVADNHDRIFDVRGIRSIVEFNKNVVMKLVLNAGPGKGVLTRYYSETSLSLLPLRVKPDEFQINAAIAAISANPYYLAAIPLRKQPCIPAHQAARFTYGHCVPFAEAMRQLTGLQSVALLAVRLSPHFEATQLGEGGYFHSVVEHPDGMVEDCWGKASPREVASRFGVVEFKTSGEDQRLIVEKLQRNSADLYVAALNEAKELILEHRPLDRSG